MKVQTANAYSETANKAGSYIYKVRAYRISDKNKVYGAFSSEKNITAQVFQPVLSAPSGLKKTASGTDYIKLEWDEANGINGYELERSTDNKNYKQVSGYAYTSYYDYDVTPGTGYYYRVRAYKYSGIQKLYGDYCTAIYASTAGAPAAPTGLKDIGCAHNYITIAWDKVSDAFYMAERSVDNINFEAFDVYGGSEYTDVDVESGTGYFYRVRAYVYYNKQKLYGDYSDVIYVKTPSKPLTEPWLDVKANGSYGASLSWDVVADATGYELQRSEDNNVYVTVFTGALTSASDSGLKANTIYYYKVRAYKSEGASTIYGPYSFAVPIFIGSAFESEEPIVPSESDTAQAQAPEPATTVTAPLAPTGFKASSIGSNKVTLFWDAVGTADGYELERSVNKKNFDIIKSLNAVKFGDSKLLPGSVYYYRMRAYIRLPDKTKLYGSYTPVITVKTSGKVPVVSALPSTAGLKISLSGADSAKISWSAVKNALGFEVHRSIDNKKFVKVYTGTLKTFTDSKLKAGTKYYYKVRAFVKSGAKTIYGGFSSVINVSTKAVIPAAVVGVTAKTSGDTVVITWQKVKSAAGYEVYRSTNNKAFIKVSTVVKGTAFTNTKIKAGAKYYYKVRAYSDKAYGAFSKVVSVKTGR